MNYEIDRGDVDCNPDGTPKIDPIAVREVELLPVIKDAQALLRRATREVEAGNINMAEAAAKDAAQKIRAFLGY